MACKQNLIQKLDINDRFMHWLEQILRHLWHNLDKTSTKAEIFMNNNVNARNWLVVVVEKDCIKHSVEPISMSGWDDRSGSQQQSWDYLWQGVVFTGPSQTQQLWATWERGAQFPKLPSHDLYKQHFCFIVQL